MTKLDAALATLPYERTDAEDRIIEDAARAYAALQKLAPEIGALVEAGEEFKPEPCSSELALFAEKASFFVDYSLFKDQYEMISVQPVYFNRYKKYTRAAQRANPTLKAIHDNLTKWGE